MKRHLPILFIVLTCGLAGLAGLQAVRGSRLSQQVSILQKENETKAAKIRELEDKSNRFERELSRMVEVHASLEATLKVKNSEANDWEKLRQARDADRETLLRNSDRLQTALTAATERLRGQNEDIKRQNEAMKKLVTERDSLLARHNRVAADLNELTKKWNAQQLEISRLNAGSGSTPANAPSPVRRP